MTAFNEQSRQQVCDIVEEMKNLPGAMLPILHAIQDAQGYIHADAVSIIADGLAQSRAEVHGVISFYHHFRTTPPGKHTIQVCRAEACQSMGSRQLEAHVKEKLGIGFHQTSADQQVSLEPVYCLGNCACAPSIQVNDDVVGRVTASKFDQLVDQLSTQALEVK
ncbi:formate dehydrogenase subunit gamma [Aliamphritea hakodatensis]|uniref:formate dehydrogenase subunit gamma n=1 Tax=Aliamphritea hakodatensis TaxID=2895352 RepID=UPI0022FD3C50|nr:formate dehydrogenase subunit gamma [Aliamphritea hakodatensis]